MSVLISKQAVIKAFSEWRDDDDRDLWQVIDEVPAAEPCEDAVSRETVKEQMLKYGFRAPDMTVTEFVEDCHTVRHSETADGEVDKT